MSFVPQMAGEMCLHTAELVGGSAGDARYACEKLVTLPWNKHVAPESSMVAGWWFQIFFIFIPTWGKGSNLTTIFQRGWNHQLGWNTNFLLGIGPIFKCYVMLVSGNVVSCRHHYGLYRNIYKQTKREGRLENAFFGSWLIRENSTVSKARHQNWHVPNGSWIVHYTVDGRNPAPVDR